MPRGQLVFDSDFEGGNLLSASVSPDDSAEWELKLRGDSCNSKYRLWFHFRVSNALPGQQVVLSVVNFSKASGPGLTTRGVCAVGLSGPSGAEELWNQGQWRGRSGRVQGRY